MSKPCKNCFKQSVREPCENICVNHVVFSVNRVANVWCSSPLQGLFRLYMSDIDDKTKFMRDNNSTDVYFFHKSH